METYLKYFLLVYYTLFFLFAVLIPTYRMWKATGVNPYKLGNADTAHDFIGKFFRITLIGCAVVVLMYVFSPVLYQNLLPIPYLANNVPVWLAIVLLAFALIWVLTAQAHMQKSWRIGIDEDVKTELVQRGLFKISRNPIFLGIRVMLFGLFLILPNAIMLLIWVAGDMLIQIQVRLEEEFLTRKHGEAYLAYRKQVRRWI